MLACATNLFQRLVSSRAFSGAANRYFSAARPLLAVVDCSGAAAGRDFAGAAFGDAATGGRGAGAVIACNSITGISAGLSVRHPVVCGNLLLDLRHDAPVWRAAGSGGGAGVAVVLLICGALSRAVWNAAGAGGGSGRLWTKTCGVGGGDSTSAGG